MEQWRQQALQWAEAREIAALIPEPSANALAVGGVFGTEPSMDFGRLSREVPAVLWRPGSEEALREIVCFLASEGRSIVTRGTGHSSGGQSLHAGGDVVLMEGLSDIGEVDEDGSVWVQAGCLWADVCHVLRRAGRRPPVLTDNWGVTVGGSLAVGGVGLTSHRHGLQVDTIEAVRVLTVDGELHEARSGDTLFDYVLAGRGQIAILVAAKICTQKSDWMLYTRALRWSDWDAFEEDARQLGAHPTFDLFVSRVRWDAPRRYRGAVGAFDAGCIHALNALDSLNARLGVIETVDYYFEGSGAHLDRQRTVPAVEFSLPWPAGRAFLMEWWDRLEALDLAECQPAGTRICWWPGHVTAPLGPFAPTGEQVLVSLRPEVSPERLSAWLPALDALAAGVVGVGGRLNMMSYGTRSVGVADAWLGAIAEKRDALKRSFDPNLLLNSTRANG